MTLIELLLQHKEFLTILILLILLAAVGFGTFAYIKVLNAENATLKANNATLQTDLATSNASIKNLQDNITEQNNAVTKLKADADARVQSHQVEIAAANAKAETYRQQALDILRLKPTNADKCKSADDLFNKEILKNAKK